MPAQHLVRVGVLGNVGRFRCADSVAYKRGTRVICRTNRGLEIGQVLTKTDLNSAMQQIDGSVLRAMSIEDELLAERLERNRDEAYQACQRRLAEEGIPSVLLLDVEHLFDGNSLYFYFLGDVSPQVENMTNELASIYQAKVGYQEFVTTLTEGCGPDCGTENAGGGGCGSTCQNCAISGLCGS